MDVICGASRTSVSDSHPEKRFAGSALHAKLSLNSTLRTSRSLKAGSKSSPKSSFADDSSSVPVFSLYVQVTLPDLLPESFVTLTPGKSLRSLVTAAYEFG